LPSRLSTLSLLIKIGPLQSDHGQCSTRLEWHAAASSSDCQIHSYTLLKRFPYGWGLSQPKAALDAFVIRIRKKIGHQTQRNDLEFLQGAFTAQPLENTI
jgi:hypothetical protein